MSVFARMYRFFTEKPEDRPMTDALVDAIESPDAIFEHLEAVRQHLVRSAIVTVLMVAISLFFIPQLAGILAQPIGGLEKLQAITVTEQFDVLLRVAFLSGIGLSLPYIIFEIWLFVAPGLHPRSRIVSLVAIPLAFLFFVGGVVFAHLVLIPAALPWLFNLLPGIKTNPTAMEYFKFTTNFLLGVGASFEFPLVVFAFALMGLVKPGALLQHWRIAVVGIAIFAAVVTPSTDPLTMGLFMLPLIFLYYVSILFSWVAQRLRA